MERGPLTFNSSFSSHVQGGARKPNATISERQQRQPRLPHQRQTRGHLLQLQHRVQHRQACAGLPVRSPPLRGPGRRALQPQHQSVLWRLLLHVHGLPLRHRGPGPQGLQGRRLLQAEASRARHRQQPLPDLQAGRRRGSGVSPRPGRYPGGDLHGARRPGVWHGGGDQWAPADEPVHGKRQERSQLQDLQHQRGTLRKERRTNWEGKTKLD